MIVRQVADAEAAADIQFLDGEAGLLADRDGEVQKGLNRTEVCLHVAQVAADMGVQAGKQESGSPDDVSNRVERRARCDVEAELGVLLPGADAPVRVRVDARRDTNPHLLHPTASARGLVDPDGLPRVVDDDSADTLIEGARDLDRKSTRLNSSHT